MKTQQQAEREEQQRIKSLVLNYDLRDGEEQDGDLALQPLHPNRNIHKLDTGLEPKLMTVRPDKSSNNRSGQRARKLQLSDVDWYDRRSRNYLPSHSQVATRERFPAGKPASRASFSQFPRARQHIAKSKAFSGGDDLENQC